MPPAISSITREELRAQFKKQGESAYRADQVAQWVHQKYAESWEAMTNLAKRLREKMSADYTFSTVELARLEGDDESTRKFLGDCAMVSSLRACSFRQVPRCTVRQVIDILCVFQHR